MAAAEKDAAGGRDNENPQSCVICGKPQEARFLPFCSARCRDVDLHRWLSGRYAVPAEEEAIVSDAAEPGANEASGFDRSRPGSEYD